MRAVFETLGVQDVVAKSQGSSNPYNMVRATFDALKNQLHPKDVAARRGIKYATLRFQPPGVLASRRRKNRSVAMMAKAKKTLVVEQIGSA